jgi:hypothetical protein
MAEDLLAYGWGGTGGLSNEVKKGATDMKHFSLKHSHDFLPISKNRRLFSLDSPRKGRAQNVRALPQRLQMMWRQFSRSR